MSSPPGGTPTTAASGGGASSCTTTGRPARRKTSTYESPYANTPASEEVWHIAVRARRLSGPSRERVSAARSGSRGRVHRRAPRLRVSAAVGPGSGPVRASPSCRPGESRPSSIFLMIPSLHVARIRRRSRKSRRPSAMSSRRTIVYRTRSLVGHEAGGVQHQPARTAPLTTEGHAPADEGEPTGRRLSLLPRVALMRGAVAVGVWQPSAESLPEQNRLRTRPAMRVDLA